jgi:hypothetical protein
VDHSGLRGALVFSGFNVTKEKKVLDFGPIHAETRETERIPVPPALARVLVAGGIVVVVIGAMGLADSLFCHVLIGGNQRFECRYRLMK